MQPASLPPPVFLNVEFIFSWLTNKFSIFKILGLIYFLASILILIAITVLIYALVRLAEIKKEDQKKIASGTKSSKELEDFNVPSNLPGAQIIDSNKNEIWHNIRTKLLSESVSDWRLAIIEADIYLDRELDKRGFTGETLGDKLKRLTIDNLSSTQNAWAAHKVRNRIAHEGVEFVLTRPLARQALADYEIVFRELNLI